MRIKKITPARAAFLQVFGVAVYCLFISRLFDLLNHISGPDEEGSMVVRAAFMLILLVFSAAVTGALVFGYPVWLAMNKKIKEALSVLGFTALYFLVLLAAFIMMIAI